MSATCGYVTCARREHLVAVLIKCALDTATSLDELKGAVRNLAPSLLSQHEFDKLQGMVERTYDAIEQLGVEIGKPVEPMRIPTIIKTLPLTPDDVRGIIDAINHRKGEV